MVISPPIIDAPTGEREVLKVNIFDRMSSANTMLMPLFPYLGPGAILVAGALVGGGPDALGTGGGTFYHQNTQQEVTVTYGAAGFVRAPGDFAVNPDTHPNHRFFTTEDPAEHVALVAVTQRQRDPGDARPQTESIGFRCQRCGQSLYEFDYSATPGERPQHPDESPAGADTDLVPVFPTLWGTYTGSARFAADEKLRTCAKCGHVTEPFEYWSQGSQRYMNQHRAANIARQSLLNAAHHGGEKS